MTLEKLAKLNSTLNNILVLTGKNKKKFARSIKMCPCRLSKIIHNVITPNSYEKEKIAKALNCDIDEIFD